MELIDILFILIWIILPILWHVMLKAAGLSLLKPTLPSFVIAFIFILQYIGLPILYFRLDVYRAQFVTDKYLVMLVWGMTSITITLMIIGYLFARQQFGRLEGFAKPNVPAQPLNNYQKVALFALGTLGIAVLYIYLSKVGFGNIALLASLGLGGDIEQKLARSLMGNDFDGKYHWYRLFMRDILTFVFLVFLAQNILFRNKFNIFLLLIFGSALSLSLVMATEKGPFAHFILALLLISVWVKFKGQLKIRVLVKAIIVMTSFLVLFYMYLMNSLDVGTGLSSMLSRIFTGQMQPAYHYLEFFPAHQDWLYGRSFPNPGGLLPFDSYSLSAEIMNFMSPELQATSGVVGSAPTVYWGELYANFSFFGVLAFPMLVGYVLYLLNKLIFSLPLNPITVSFFVWSLIHYSFLAGTNLSKYIIDMDLVIFLLLLVLLNAIKPHRGTFIHLYGPSYRPK